jgi:REP element-mobilizing transposase RayT
MAGYTIYNQYHTHFLTSTTVGWLDIFTYPVYRDIIINSLRYCQKEKGLVVYAYVIMSNHIHLIARAEEDSKGLSKILGDFKQFTAKSIIQQVQQSRESRKGWLLNAFTYHAKFNSNNKEFQVWQQHNRPIELASPRWINQKIIYIHNNPVRAKWVAIPEHYLYSSASNYINGEGLLDVEVIDLGISEGYISM